MEQQFLRNQMLWGQEGQHRLAESHVILFGLGGVGSYTAECLARAGVGELTIVDNDTVGLTNLNRQLEALHSTIGQNKTDAVAARLRGFPLDEAARMGAHLAALTIRSEESTCPRLEDFLPPEEQAI